MRHCEMCNDTGWVWVDIEWIRQACTRPECESKRVAAAGSVTEEPT